MSTQQPVVRMSRAAGTIDVYATKGGIAPLLRALGKDPRADEVASSGYSMVNCTICVAEGVDIDEFCVDVKKKVAT